MNIIDSVEPKQILTPWEVKGKVDYLVQINHFGTTPIDGKLIERWEKITKTKAHRFLRRGIVFSHQDIDKILDCVEKGILIYIYTGRGPSSTRMHLGHLVPFKFTQYLQKALNCIVVIQMSDDEKFFFKEGSIYKDLDKYRKFGYENAKDIIACGFDVNKTLIFSNLDSNKGDLYFNNTLLMKSTNMNSIKAIYGIGETIPKSVLNILSESLANENAKEEKDTQLITDLSATIKKFSNDSSNNLGQCVWPAFQCGPAFCTSFRDVFIRAIKYSLQTNPEKNTINLKNILKSLISNNSYNNIMCLVPMAIDQAPYFRMARDSASILNCPKPAVIHSEFLPGLKQSQGKMSSTTTTNSSGTLDPNNSTLFLDMKSADIIKTIKSHAFSGGKTTAKEHKMYGGDIRIDICYQYLTYFMESDEELKTIAEKYTSGEMGSGDLKILTADIVAKEIADHQSEVAKLTTEKINEFYDWDRILDISGLNNTDANIVDNNVNYDNYGINFDRTFGFRCKDVL